MPPTTIRNNYSFFERILFPDTHINIDALRKKVEGKTILITGASYGIGEQLAYLLAPTGAMQILVARTQDKLEDVCTQITELGGTATYYAVDLTKEDELDRLIASLHLLPHGIDIVVSNAGKSIHRYLYASMDRYHDFTRTMSLNYLAPVKLLLALLPRLEENHGQLINISAINVLLAPAPGWAAYQASKVAFDNWFRCIGPELVLNGMKATTIYLPLVKTRMIEPTKAYNNMPAMHPAHVARIIAKTMYTRKTRYRPWWLFIAQFSSLIFRYPWEKITENYLKRIHAKNNTNP